MEDTEKSPAQAKNFTQNIINAVATGGNIESPGADMVWSIHRTLESTARERLEAGQRSTSEPRLTDILHPEIGGASALGGPNAFRREHLGVEGDNATMRFIISLGTDAVRSYFNVFGPGEVDTDSTLAPELKPLLARAQYGEVKGGADDDATSVSTPRAVITFFKGMIGTFILYLPRLFSRAGESFSALSIACIGVLATYHMLLLSECHSVVRGSYGELGERAFGAAGRSAVNGSIVLSQLAYCSTYFTYVRRNVHDAMANTALPAWLVAESTLMLLQLLLYVPLSWVKGLRALGASVLVANTCLLSGLVLTFGYATELLIQRGPAYPIAQYDARGVVLFLGSVIICYEGICLVVPIKQSMRRQEHFEPMVLAVMTVLIALFVFVGSVGYLAFGEATETFVTLNLPHTAGGCFAKLAYAGAIMLTYPLMLFPALQVIQQTLLPSAMLRANDASGALARAAVGTLLVLFTALVSLLAGRQFDNFVSLVGALCAAPLAVIYPAMLHMRLCSARRWRHNMHAFMVVAGVSGAAFCTVSAIVTWH